MRIVRQQIMHMRGPCALAAQNKHWTGVHLCVGNCFAVKDPLDEAHERVEHGHEREEQHAQPVHAPVNVEEAAA